MPPECGRSHDALPDQRTSEPLWLPVHCDLKAILDEAKKARSSTTIVVGAKGRPYTQSGFQTRFFGLIRKLREAGKIAPGLSFHGRLRHTVGTRLAETGCDPQTVAAMLGQLTQAMANHYSKHANRKSLVRNAVHRMERNGARKRKTAADRGGKPDIEK